MVLPRLHQSEAERSDRRQEEEAEEEGQGQARPLTFAHESHVGKAAGGEAEEGSSEIDSHDGDLLREILKKSVNDVNENRRN